MASVDRRAFLREAAAGVGGLAAWRAAGARAAQPVRLAGRRPNIVVIFCDDLGYGDLGCFGHPTIQTPNIDRMCREGTKLTQFYSSSPVCTPSRAALNTGRLPIRSGMCGEPARVCSVSCGGGLPESEVTTAEILGRQGYSTACIGKWHLGHLKKHLPTRHGFDEYFGIPYSNDMKPTPLVDGEDTIEEPAVQNTLTQRYTARCLDFISRHENDPFFLYYAQTFPHTPLHASEAFEGSSPRGLFGDVVAELDWSVGQLLDALRARGLAENTFVLLTSDNGPWLIRNLDGGSAGLLRGGKGSTWEGGVREPCIAWWPGVIEAGATSQAMASTLDVLPTCCELAGVPAPDDRALDGVTLLPILEGGVGLRAAMPFWRGTRLMAYRSGPWKAHFTTQAGYGEEPVERTPPLLFNLEWDPSEAYGQAADHPDIVERITREAEAHKASIEPAPCQLTVPLPEGVERGRVV